MLAAPPELFDLTRATTRSSRNVAGMFVKLKPPVPADVEITSPSLTIAAGPHRVLPLVSET